MDLPPSTLFGTAGGDKHQLNSFKQDRCIEPTIKAANFFSAPHESHAVAMPDWKTWQSSLLPLIGTTDPRAADQVFDHGT
jgi:hypothetical protein